MSTEKRTQMRLEHIDGLRALAALVPVFDKGYVRSFWLPWQLEDELAGLATLCLLVAVMPGERGDSCAWLRNALAWRPLASVGMFSYSLYVVHAPVLEVVRARFIDPLHLTPVRSLMLLATAGTGAVLGVAYLIFLVCERPFIGPPGGQREHQIASPDAEGAAPALA